MVRKTAAASHQVSGSGRKGGRLLALLLLSTVLGGVPPFGWHQAQAQHAANEAVSFQIPAQPLSSAIDAFIRQSGWQISYSSALVRGKTSSGVTGNLSPGAALQRLVAGTGIAVSIGAPGSAALVDPAGAAVDLSNDGSIMLDMIVITGGGMTEGSGLYTAGATSSATGLSLEPRETPQSVSVITNQALQDIRPQTMTDALAYSTGVSAFKFETDRSDVVVRGFGVGGYVVDRLPSPISDGGGGRFMSMAMYDHIEVVRGATGLVTGPGVPGATVNISRKRADSKTFLGMAEARLGSWDRVGATLDLQGPLNAEGSLRARLVMDRESANSFLDRYHSDTSLSYGTLEYDLTSSTTLRFSAHHSENNPKGSQWGGWPRVYSDGTPTGFDRSFSHGTDWSYWATENKTALIDLEHSFDNGWSAKASIMAARSALDAEVVWTRGFAERESGLGLFATGYKAIEQQRDITLSAEVSGPIQMFERQHELSFGADIRRIWQNEQSVWLDSGLAPIGNMREWDGSYPRPEYGDLPEANWQRGATTHSARASAKFSISDPFSVVTGLRYTKWVSDDRSFNQVTPYLGLLYDVNDNLTVYASYTEIFNPQNAKDRQGRYLDPEMGRNLEIGLKADLFEGRMVGSLAAYKTYQDNVAVLDGDGPASGTGEYAYIGAKGVVTKGFEAELSGELQPGWNLSAGLSYSDPKGPDGKPVDTSFPTRTFKLFTTYNPSGDWSRWTIGGGVRWQNKTWSAASTDLKPFDFVQKSYHVVDMMLRYEISDSVSAQLNVRNLFDKVYFDRGFAANAFYGEPRNVMFTLNTRF